MSDALEDLVVEAPNCLVIETPNGYRVECQSAECGWSWGDDLTLLGARQAAMAHAVWHHKQVRGIRRFHRRYVDESRLREMSPRD